MDKYGYTIVLDFDGTVVTHRYPEIGEDIGAEPVLKMLVENGHKLILSTMRSRDSEGVDRLQPALDWFSQRNIPLAGVNENPEQKSWTASPKVYGNLYIDDSALGVPLKTDESEPRPYVDWGTVAAMLFYMELLSVENIQHLITIGLVKIQDNTNMKA